MTGRYRTIGMTDMAPEQSGVARDTRALAVASLLRCGWTGRAISAGLKVIDAGGGVALAMEAMRAAQHERGLKDEGGAR